MLNKFKKVLSFSLMTIGFVFLVGILTEVSAQTDPFLKKTPPKPPAPKPINTNQTNQPNQINQPVKSNTDTPKPPPVPKPTPKPVLPVVAPPIDQRIAYYKQMRDEHILKGLPLPKVTAVLTLDEMTVSGITKTSKGYAAMIEAKPLKLSYTIYPGEKFFDCQLVAVEENKLVFRKVTKMSNGQFISSTQERTLREYSFMEDVQGTSPVGSSSGKQESANSQPALTNSEQNVTTKASFEPVLSPLDEMNNPQQSSKNSMEAERAKAKVKNAKDKSSQPNQKTKSKKPVKVAKK
jgi:hypothetical protein